MWLTGFQSYPKSLFHPHGSLRAGYAKCYFLHLLYFRLNHEKSIKEVNNELNECKQQRDVALQEVSTLKVNIQLAYDHRDNLKEKLKETLNKCQDGR